MLPPWPPHAALVPRVLAMVSGTWRICKFFQRPESRAKHTGKSPGQQSSCIQSYPSSFVIFSCKARTFLTVLSKYGKSFMQNIQRVHLSMVCDTQEPQSTTADDFHPGENIKHRLVVSTLHKKIQVAKNQKEELCLLLNLFNNW